MGDPVLQAKLEGHLDTCAVRYEQIAEQHRAIHARLKRIEVGNTGALIFIIALLLKLVLK